MGAVLVVPPEMEDAEARLGGFATGGLATHATTVGVVQPWPRAPRAGSGSFRNEWAGILRYVGLARPERSLAGRLQASQYSWGYTRLR
jgi:hypothetical protein